MALTAGMAFLAHVTPEGKLRVAAQGTLTLSDQPACLELLTRAAHAVIEFNEPRTSPLDMTPADRDTLAGLTLVGGI